MFKQLFFVLCVIGSSLTASPKIDSALKTCVPKFPTADPDFINNLCDASYQISNKDTKCLLKCVGEEIGLLSADGTTIVSFVKNTAPSFIDQAKLDVALAKCTAMVKSDACDTAYDQWKCNCDIK